MAKNEKGLNAKLYAVVSFVVIAVFLVLTCVTTFRSRYTAFHSDEIAKSYVDTIVQSGDGYNAYKNTLASKSSKYGDFIRKNYIYPVVYRDTEFKIGDSTDDYTGYNDDSYIGQATADDNGTLTGELIDAMYDYYVELVETYSWDDYDSIYVNYLNKLVETRAEIYGDDYMSDDVFFTVFESNVSAYGDSLTGTEDKFDENTGDQLSYKSTGIYQEIYGEDYKFTVSVESETDIDLDSYKQYADDEAFATYGVSVDDISAAKTVHVTVADKDGQQLAELDVIVAQIGMSWYVDNTVTNTQVLYNFYK